jgi:hypothetical protein
MRGGMSGRLSDRGCGLSGRLSDRGCGLSSGLPDRGCRLRLIDVAGHGREVSIS